MTSPHDPDADLTEQSKLIAELHAAGYANWKIGMLLIEYGARNAASERTVRHWALRQREMRYTQFVALKAMHTALVALVVGKD